MSALNIHILSEVFSLLDHNNLAQLSLVSRTYQSVTQPSLHSKIKITRKSQLDGFE